MKYNERYAADTQKLMDALFATHDLTHIINVASKIFNNPIFIIDQGFRLITKSDAAVEDSIWNDLVKTGYYSYDNLKLAKNDKRYTVITKSKEPVYIHISSSDSLRTLENCTFLQLDKKVLSNSRLVNNLYKENNRIGSITIIEYNKTIEQYHIDLLKFLSKIILLAIDLSPGEYNTTGGNSFANILDDILSNKISNKASLNSRLNFCNIHLKKYFFVIAIQSTLPYSDSSGIELKHYQTILSYLFKNKNTIIYENNIIYLFDTNDKTLFENSSFRYRLIYYLISILKENNLICGMSSVFEDLLELKKYYSEAIKALMFGKIHDNSKYFYPYKAEYIFEEMVSDLVANSDNYTNYCHPAFIAIQEYDKSNGTDYLNTLKIYIKNFNNLNIAAKELFIHRNSLSYRINKISDIFDVDLNDINTLVHLYISFCMYEHQSKL